GHAGRCYLSSLGVGLRFILAQSYTGADKHRDTDRAKNIHEHSSCDERKMSPRGWLHEAEGRVGEEGHGRIPRRRECQTMAVWTRAKGRTIAERNSENRQPGNEQSTHDKPGRKAWEDAVIKRPLSHRSDEETLTCHAECVHYAKMPNDPIPRL